MRRSETFVSTTRGGVWPRAVARREQRELCSHLYERETGKGEFERRGIGWIDLAHPVANEMVSHSSPLRLAPSLLTALCVGLIWGLAIAVASSPFYFTRGVAMGVGLIFVSLVVVSIASLFAGFCVYVAARLLKKTLVTCALAGYISLHVLSAAILLYARRGEDTFPDILLSFLLTVCQAALFILLYPRLSADLPLKFREWIYRKSSSGSPPVLETGSGDGDRRSVVGRRGRAA